MSMPSRDSVDETALVNFLNTLGAKLSLKGTTRLCTVSSSTYVAGNLQKHRLTGTCQYVLLRMSMTSQSPMEIQPDLQDHEHSESPHLDEAAQDAEVNEQSVLVGVALWDHEWTGEDNRGCGDLDHSVLYHLLDHIPYYW